MMHMTYAQVLRRGFSLAWGEAGCRSNCSKDQHSKVSKLVRIVIGAAATLSCFVALCCFFYCSTESSWIVTGRLLGRWITDSDKDVEAFITQYGRSTPKRYRYSEIKTMTNGFKHKIGKGGYGSVFKGKLSDDRPVAIKVLNSSAGKGEDFLNEVASIGRTSHINVVSLLGICCEGKKRALIYEFMPNGSLEKFVSREVQPEMNQNLGLDKLHDIALGIARGLEYLHRGCSARILHLDIKPHNILLDHDFCPKISDFGLAKLHSRGESNVSILEIRGTLGYIAPEVLNRSIGRVSHKSDVYSYGMLILEIVGARNDINSGLDQTSSIYFPVWIYEHLKHKGTEHDGKVTDSSFLNNEITKKMVLVGLWCIQIDPSQRPSINKVIEMLEGSTESLQIPPKPVWSSPLRMMFSSLDKSPSITLERR